MHTKVNNILSLSKQFGGGGGENLSHRHIRSEVVIRIFYPFVADYSLVVLAGRAIQRHLVLGQADDNVGAGVSLGRVVRLCGSEEIMLQCSIC